MSLYRGKERAKIVLAHPCPAKPVATFQSFPCVATLHGTNVLNAYRQATRPLRVFLPNWFYSNAVLTEPPFQPSPEAFIFDWERAYLTCPCLI